jgi:orotate phosphoribosyltransferase
MQSPEGHMERDELAVELFQKCYLTGEYPVRTGGVVTEYFDKYQFESDPTLLSAVADHLSTLLPQQTEVLAAIELGGVPLGIAISAWTSLPLAIIRRKRKHYGTRRLIEGPSLAGRRVVIVDAIVATGSQTVQCAGLLTRSGASVIGAACVIDKEAGGPVFLAQHGLPLCSLFTKSHLLLASFTRKESSPSPGVAVPATSGHT